jgi:hypothetical protein
MRYNNEKKCEGGRSDRNFSGVQNEHPKTSKKLGKEYGVSELTIRRDGTQGIPRSMRIPQAGAGAMDGFRVHVTS